MKLNVPEISRPQGAARSGGPTKKKVLRWCLVLLVVAAVVFFLVARNQSREQSGKSVETAYTTASVERRDITASITGSGTLQAANSYSVTTLVEGEILTADFEEGDEVEKGTVLYTVDSSDVNDSLEQAQLSLEQAQRSYARKQESQEDLTVTAPCDGQIISLDVEQGDDVNSGQAVATIRNSDIMCLEVPFPSDDAVGFALGQGATVTLDSTFEILEGTVSDITGYDTVLSGNRIVRNVTIEVANPGALSTSQTATASVGDVTSTSGGTFTYQEEEVVTVSLSGEVRSLLVEEGTRVQEGTVLMYLESENLTDELENAADSVKNAERSLKRQQEQLKDYIITSPIKGTIIDKNLKAGETVGGSGSNNQVLCTIYDLSYLTMTLDVDELDIGKMEVGQQVTLTAEAVEGKTYQGIVTKVSVAGASTGSTTTYPVTVRVDETEGLLPGMTVDAEIILNSASDVLTIPASALMRGNRVLVTADSPSAANGTPVESESEEEDTAYVSVTVTVGTGDDEYLEVTSGLQEGDTVAYIPTNNSEMPWGQMMPGGPGGGMPGGPGGGRPGGM